jgi:hypothetical protein
MKQVLANALDPQVSCRLVKINSSSYEAVQIEVSFPFTSILLASNVLRAEGWAPREEQ